MKSCRGLQNEGYQHISAFLTLNPKPFVCVPFIQDILRKVNAHRACNSNLPGARAHESIGPVFERTFRYRFRV